MPSTASRFFMRARQGTITSLVETRSAMFAVVRQVIFLNGPIGAGKTTLGRALANDLCAAFLDSDDLRDRSKRWYEETLTLANALVRAGTSALTERPLLVIAMPLRARDWAFFCARFRAQETTTYCVTLAADLDAILDPRRGRAFDAGERARIAEMIAQGYAARPFSDLIVDSGRQGFAETLGTLAADCRSLLAARAVPR